MIEEPHGEPRARQDGTPIPVSIGAFRYDRALEPDPLLSQMLVESPVCRVRMPYGQGTCWLVTRYADVRTVTTDPRFSRAALIGRDYPRITPAPIAQAEAINLMDPPTLTRLRQLVAAAFTSGRVEQLRTVARREAGQLLDVMVRHGAPADVASLRHRRWARNAPTDNLVEANVAMVVLRQ